MKWFIAYMDEGVCIVKDFETQEAMVTCAGLFKHAGIEIVCVWSEVNAAEAQKNEPNYQGEKK